VLDITINNRAQSSVLGPILLIGVFVTVGVVSGGAVITSVVDQSTELEANLNAEIEDGELTLTHMGGDSVATDRLHLLIESGGTERIDFTQAELESLDGSFDAGDVWSDDLASRTEFSGRELQSGISVRLVTNSGDVVASVSTIEEIVQTQTPEQYVPGGTDTPTATDDSDREEDTDDPEDTDDADDSDDNDDDDDDDDDDDTDDPDDPDDPDDDDN